MVARASAHPIRHFAKPQGVIRNAVLRIEVETGWKKTEAQFVV